MSPVAETSDRNKRPAIICDFFAKGWCIRGTSCKFVHIKDNLNSTHPQGDVAAANCTREVQPDEGLRDITERSRSPGFPDPLASSHLSSEKIRFSEHKGIQRRHQSLENHKFPAVPGEESNMGKYSRGNPTSQSSCMDEPAGIWSQRMHSDHNSPLVSLSLNSNSSNLLTNGSFPASRISSWTGFSLPSSYSCLDASPHGTQKLLDRNRDYHYSTRSSPLLKSSSPFSSSELKKLPSTSVSLRSDKLKTKISSNDWEPSVPFQPSFILPPAFLSSSGSQYDPLRDSIDLPKLANISFEASFYSEEAAIGNKLHHQILGESVSGTMRPVCDGDTNSMSSHNTCHEKVLDNSCYTREHNSPVTEAETVGASVVCQNGTMAIEENLSGPSHLKGSTKPHKTSSYGDSRPQSDSSRHKKDITVDRFRENNEVDGEHVTDGDVQQESKALRHFRAALVELVKELLKPKWREGCLSKDAHNKIVKKAVEKVLSAFQPQQIPPTVETVLQYLSSCRPKISKLVEGYVEKYGKS
ncbi:hypothetical protein PRUPE_4G051000 [Prunus persica]|nr:hypothetical protein PRUPE_4G051000 [Prunus persica]